MTSLFEGRNFKINDVFWLIFIIASLFLVVGQTLSKGMFMDGLMYAVVSRNLSEGIGTFWHPSFSASYLSDFYEHPPMAFVLQSFLFDLLGDHLLVERLYCLLTFAITSFTICCIWHEMGLHRKTSWLPLLIYISIPIVSWSYSNNMLENTMTMFSTASVFFGIKAIKRGGLLNVYLLLFTLMLLCAFLSKGPVGLFPLSVFVFYSITMNSHFSRAVYRTAVSILIISAITFLAFAMHSGIYENIKHYFANQLVSAMRGKDAASSHFFIFRRLFSELIPPLLIGLFGFIVLKRKNADVVPGKRAKLMLLLAVAGSVPIMMSPKQSGYYLVPSFVFYSLSIAIYINRIFEKVQVKWLDKKVNRAIIYTCSILIVAGITFSFLNLKNYKRDKEKIATVKTIISLVGKEKSIGIQGEIYSDWNLRGYLERFAHITLDQHNKHNFKLTKTDEVEEGYSLIFSSNEYYLYNKSKR